jgi:CRP/FNR family transcriptional regulator, polysaccharide utilization system transcription regulator
MRALVAPNELKVQLIAAGSRIHSARGTFLFRHGDTVTGIFLVSTGAVRLGLDEEPAAFPSRQIGPGSVVGLPAALSNSPYSLSAEVLEDSELVYLSRERLIHLLRAKPELSMRVIEVLTEELTQTRVALERVRKVAG